VTDRYAVIGNPIGHSKSPQIHRAFAAATGEDIAYEAIEGAPGAFRAAASAFRAAGGRGMNVTAPFKLDAFAYADERSDRAMLAGAANTLSFTASGVLADNFDGIGLVRDLRDNLGCRLEGARILLLGAGGAARGLLQPLVDERPAEVVLVNRTVPRARDVARQVPGDVVRHGGYDEIGPGRFDVVVNATSASVHGELPPVPATAFAPDGVAYDLAYGIGLTPFLRLAREAGVRGLADGVGMLVEQAAESFAWWRGMRPDTRAIIAQLTVPLD
jgi:shikimate dehydrogenase